MDYEALINLLGLQKYRKAILKSTITLIRHNENSNKIEVFLCVEETWSYELYSVFKMSLEKFTGCTVSLQFMATKTSVSAHDIKLFINDFVNTNSIYSVFSHFFPIIEGNDLICSFNTDKLAQANRYSSELSSYLHKMGINYNVVIKETSVSVKTEIENRPTKETKSTYSPAPKINGGFGKRKLPDSYEYHQIKDITDEMSAVQIKAKVFMIDDPVVRKNEKIIMSYYVTDYTDSIIVKCFEGQSFDKEFLQSIKKGEELIISGNVSYDTYARELTLLADTMVKKTIFEKRVDECEEKRIELHAHTKMSEMDAVCETSTLIQRAAEFGHKAIAITDHMNVQAYPDAQNTWAKVVKGNPDFKLIYGIEMNMVDPILDIVVRPNEYKLNDVEYCVFDLETTGLSARYDEIIEFGCVIMKAGEVKEKIDFFIKPVEPIPAFIVGKTNITNEDVMNAISIQEALPKILEIVKGRVLVAHNAKFDIGFLNAKLVENGYGELTNSVIDTLDLARAMLKQRRSYSLGAISRYYKVEYNEEVAHRADYDADVLANVFYLMICDLRRENVDTLQQMQDYQDSESFKKVRRKHVTLLVKNQKGLKDLFKLVSLSNINYLATFGKGGGEEVAAEPRIPREEIQKLREDLLVGSSCQNGEIFELAINKTEKELREALEFYDYIEIQPIECYSNLIDSHSVRSYERLKLALTNLIKTAQEMGKLVVASGDVHYIEPEDKIFRDVYISSQGIGGARHPLYYFNKEMRHSISAPDQHFRTTQEMLDSLSYLGDELAHELVIDNPNKIYDLIEIVKPLHTELHKPHLEGDEENLKKITYDNAHKQYGNPLPEIVEKRIEKELKSIIGNGFTVIYYSAHLLVKKSNDDGYIVGSRGSVGSSFVATMMGITEVNPLIPHYYCPHCQHSEWFTDGSVLSGYDLPNKPCPKCGTTMKGDGQNIEFETFLGFYGDKVPDIDLNFSGEYQEHAHAYTKVLFGDDHVFRAGTIGGVAEKTAFGYVSGYFEDREIENVRSAEKLRLAQGCQDVKRTTGQHPGGIIVIPQHMDVHDFTPMQLPANNPESAWRTSHFDFHAIHDNVLKLDILGHVDPTVLKMLERVSGVNPKTIPMNDEKVISLFSSTDALCLDTTGYHEKTGAIGLPEFGTPFVRGMLEDTLPTSFAELVQISGLSHGTDVWLGNAKDLIDQNVCKLMSVIGCRDDIMNTLISYGLENKMAFDIMESVRKGKGLKPEMKEAMEKNNVPEYYINSCLKIKYLFPKGHAVAYVLSALRITWFKVHMPHFYYAVYFTTRCDAYDIEGMSKGLEEVQKRLADIQYRKNHPELKKSVTNKENALITTYEVVEEMYLRGYSMSMIDLDLSLASEFRVHPENDHIIIPPFTSLDGLGESVAHTVIEAREKMPFISQEDLLKRTSLSQTHVKKLEEFGVLKNLQKENQLSLF